MRAKVVRMASTGENNTRTCFSILIKSKSSLKLCLSVCVCVGCSHRQKIHWDTLRIRLELICAERKCEAHSKYHIKCDSTLNTGLQIKHSQNISNFFFFRLVFVSRVRVDYFNDNRADAESEMKMNELKYIEWRNQSLSLDTEKRKRRRSHPFAHHCTHYTHFARQRRAQNRHRYISFHSANGWSFSTNTRVHIHMRARVRSLLCAVNASITKSIDFSLKIKSSTRVLHICICDHDGALSVCLSVRVCACVFKLTKWTFTA